MEICTIFFRDNVFYRLLLPAEHSILPCAGSRSELLSPSSTSKMISPPLPPRHHRPDPPFGTKSSLRKLTCPSPPLPERIKYFCSVCKHIYSFISKWLQTVHDLKPHDPLLFCLYRNNLKPAFVTAFSLKAVQHRLLKANRGIVAAASNGINAG